MKGAHDLKQLRTRLEKAEAEHRTALQAVKDAQRAEQAARTKAGELRKQVEAFAGKQPVVSEHAMLRYVERVMGLDLEALRRDILTGEAEQYIRAFGSGKVPTPTCRLVVKDRVVVTVEPL